MGMSPLIDSQSKVLILGSIPGDKSIALQHYYGHKQNRFWPLMARLLNEPLPDEYSDRVLMLKSHKIALWDVAHSAIRPGSLDSAIRNEVPNAINLLLEKYTSIERIGFNGKKASAMYQVFFECHNDISYFDLPSSSPANASYSFERLCLMWEPLFEGLI